MKASFVQLGQAIDFVPSRDVAAGEILVCNGLAGAVKIPVKAGELGALHLTGIYDVEKTAVPFGAGDRVYLDQAAGKATDAATGNIYLGVSACIAPASAPVARVILNFGRDEGTGSGSSENIEWQTLA